MIKENIFNSDKNNQLFLLLKFGKEEHIKDLYENGTLYLKDIQSLRNGDDFRNDTYEGVSKVGSGLNGTITARLPNGEPFTFNYLKLTYSEKSDFVYGNICSFYSISSNNFKNGEFIPIDERMQEFGTHVILINDIGLFFQRIKDKIKELKLNCYYGLVEYFDEYSYQGEPNAFQKRIKYDYQREFRVFIKSNKLEPIKISLGSLKDISKIGISSTINQLKVKAKIVHN